MGGLWLPVRIAEDGKVLFETERERPGEPHGDKQIGDSVELSDTDLRNISDMAWSSEGMRLLAAVRIDEVDHDAVVMQRLADIMNLYGQVRRCGQEPGDARGC